jgi:alpha-glucoside transport system ATP-binding protein
MTDIVLANVSKSFGVVQVINDLSLAVNSGELVVFLGPSGSGKSTLLRMIAGLERITGGVLTIDGEPMNDVPPAQRGIAMVFQSYALYPHMTVRDNMSFGMKIAKRPKAEIEKAVDNAARLLQLTPYLDRLPKALSGGQRQRVAIGRAIVRDPKVFLFDEPLSNLDAALRVATRIEIAQLKERMAQSTMIYVTHDQVEAMTLATRIVVLNGGNIEQVGSPLDLYERPENVFVARFIGSPSMNIFKGRVAETGESTGVDIDGGGHTRLTVPSQGGDKGAEVQVGVRSEDLVPTDAAEAIFEGEVSMVEALGETTLLYFTPQNGEEPIIAKLPGIHKFKRGQKVRLAAASEKLHLFDARGRSYLHR